MSPLTIRGALPPDLRLDLRACVEAALERLGLTEEGRWHDFVPNHSPDWIAIQQAVLGTPAMQTAREHLASVVSDAVGREVSPRHADVVRVFGPHSEGTTPAHQDAHYFRDTPPRYVAWVALTEPERGRLELFEPEHSIGAVLPHTGQHAAGPYLEDVPPGRWVRAMLDPGDAVVFDVLTIHRGTANPSDGPRISIDVRLDL